MLERGLCSVLGINDPNACKWAMVGLVVWGYILLITLGLSSVVSLVLYGIFRMSGATHQWSKRVSIVTAILLVVVIIAVVFSFTT